MANDTSAIKLPPGYEDAKPVGSSAAAVKPPVQLPSGYEDAKPVNAAPAATPTSQPSKTADYLKGTLYPQVLQGVNEVAQPVVQVPKELLAPPTNPTEQLLHAVSPGGLPLYRLARNLISTAERVKMAGPADYQQAVTDYNNAIQQIKAHDWRNAIPSAVEAASGALSTVNPVMALGNSNVRELAEGSRPGGNLATPLTKDIVTAGLAIAPEFAEGGAFAAPAASAAAPAATPAAQAATRMRVNPFRGAISGGEAVQPAIQRVAGEAADTAATEAGVPVASKAGGVRTYLDQPIADVAARERATYDRLNKAATSDPAKPVDLKNLYDYREEIEDALSDPTNITKRQELNVELNRTNMQIANGEATAQANGVAPGSLKNAIADTRTRYALQELKKRLFDNEGVVSGNLASGAPETIDVNKAIDAVEKLDKPSKYAPEGGPTRLEQALGKNGAKQFKDNLYAAQKAHQSAVRANMVAKWLGGLIGGGAVVEGASKILGS